MLGQIRVSSLLSFIICIAAVIALVVINNRLKQNIDGEYANVFEENGEEVSNDQDN